MNGIDAVIFDLGNVLITVDEARAMERMAARTGKTPEQIREYIRGTPHEHELALGKLSKKQFFHTVAPGTLGFDGTYDEFALIWSEVFTPIEPMIALAESLKTRLPRLLLSNTNAIHMDYIFERLPVSGRFRRARALARGRPAQARRGHLPIYAGEIRPGGGTDGVSGRPDHQRGGRPPRRDAGHPLSESRAGARGVDETGRVAYIRTRHFQVPQ